MNLINIIREEIKKFSLREDIENDIQHGEELKKTGFWGKSGAGAIILAKETGRILLPKRSSWVLQPNTWGVWGGAVDMGKSPEEAVSQEIEEECGYNGNFELYPLYVFHDAESGFKYHNFLAVVDKEFKPTLNWETDTFGWFELNDLPSPLHFGLAKLLNDKKSVDIINKFIAVK